MTREEAQEIVRKWGDSHEGEWFSVDDDGLKDVSIDGMFDFESLLDQLGVAK